MPAPLFTLPEPTGRSTRSGRSASFARSGPSVPAGPLRPAGPSCDRPRLGPRGLLSRRGPSPDVDGPSCRRTRPARVGGGAPRPPARPLPAALLPLPAGFELNRDPAASVVPA